MVRNRDGAKRGIHCERKILAKYKTLTLLVLNFTLLNFATNLFGFLKQILNSAAELFRRLFTRTEKAHSDVSVKMLTTHIIYGGICDSHLI